MLTFGQIYSWATFIRTLKHWSSRCRTCRTSC